MRICTGVSQRPPTHPNPVDKAEQLCQQFVMRSDPLNLNAATQKILDTLHPQREAMIPQAINSNCVTDQPFNISELELALHRKKDTAPGEDECTYSMIRQSPMIFKLQFLKLCNQTWEKSKLPNKWKAAKLFPITKEDGNFRPISLITVMSKVCEKMVLNRLRWNA